MIATVDIADLGIGGTVRSVFGRPAAKDVPGLRWADVLVLAPLGMTRPPSLKRAAMLAFWDDEDAAKAFRCGEHPIARRFEGGFHADLRPLRAFGTWPGLPSDIPSTRAVPHDGPVVVFTLGRLRPSQLIRFLRTSRPAEKAAIEADGLLFGTASAKPPVVATVTMWSTSAAAAAYAYGKQRPQHHDAIDEQQRKDFHRESAFVRFAPISVEGTIGGVAPIR